MSTFTTKTLRTEISVAARWIGLAAFCLLAGRPLAAQLVNVSVEAHQTTLHSYPSIRDTVVWSVDANRQLTSFQVQLIDPDVTLERPYPPGLYLWALPGWSFHTDPDFLGWSAVFTDLHAPPGPQGFYFGIEYAPDPVLTAALLRADVQYDVSDEYPSVTVVPEPATWGVFGPLLIGVAVAAAGRRRRAAAT